jgi:hypothetical protein
VKVLERVEAQWLVAIVLETRQIVLRLRKRNAPIKSREEARGAFGGFQGIIGPTPPTGDTLDEAKGVGHDQPAADWTGSWRGRHETGAERLWRQHSDFTSWEQASHYLSPSWL